MRSFTQKRDFVSVDAQALESVTVVVMIWNFMLLRSVSFSPPHTHTLEHKFGAASKEARSPPRSDDQFIQQQNRIAVVAGGRQQQRQRQRQPLRSFNVEGSVYVRTYARLRNEAQSSGKSCLAVIGIRSFWLRTRTYARSMEHQVHIRLIRNTQW